MRAVGDVLVRISKLALGAGLLLMVAACGSGSGGGGGQSYLLSASVTGLAGSRLRCAACPEMPAPGHRPWHPRERIRALLAERCGCAGDFQLEQSDPPGSRRHR